MWAYSFITISTALASFPAGIYAGKAGQAVEAAAAARKDQGILSDECHILVYTIDPPVLFAYGKNEIGRRAVVMPTILNNDSKDPRFVPVRKLRREQEDYLEKLDWLFNTRADETDPTKCVAEISSGQYGWDEDKYLVSTERTKHDTIIKYPYGPNLEYKARMDPPGFLYI
ncbi:hypothetical protein PspLS_09960 [Pyricularia sp. CBS 133598]|nr:hypothetical protein PspLS_09960 [Pyricularia sp. CBS 133598]